MDISNFKTELNKQPQKFINSKLACLKLIEALNASTTRQRNNFMNAVMRYAASDTDQSSFYIKVH